MNDKIMVSIICNAYNHEKYIRCAIEGFLMQKTNFRIEVLIHDDASTDKTASIIKEYEKKYPDIIKPVYQTINQYSKKAQIMRKFQYPRVKGKYIAFCEGDDYWTDSSKLQKQVDILEAHPEYSCVSHKFICVDEFGEKIDRTFDIYVKYKGDYVYTVNDFADNKLPGQTATKVFRNVFLLLSEKEKNKYNAAKANGDRKSVIPLLKYGNIYCIDEVMSAYRITNTGDSWTARHKDRNNCRHYFDTFESLTDLSKYFLKKDIDLKELMDKYVCDAFLIMIVKKRKNDVDIFFDIFKRSKDKLKLTFKIIGFFVKMSFKKAFSHGESIY